MKIDIVIPWVDGSDPNWIKKKSCYQHNNVRLMKNTNDYVNDTRYRNYGTLKYVFRSVDENASWVNKVFLITDGQKPEWLNKKCSKLVVIDHKDFIPIKYLPTFNSNTIELNIYRINELSNYFILLNDDVLFNSPVQESDFFSDNKPVDSFIMTVNSAKNDFSYILLNNMQIINRFFTKKEVIKKNFFKIFNTKYGFDLIRTFLTLPWDGINGFFNPHVGVAYSKEEFKKVLAINKFEYSKTCSNKFRTTKDINHWLVRYWRLCSGDFSPSKMNRKSKFVTIDDIGEIQKVLKSNKYKQICINDTNNVDQYNKKIQIINKLLNDRFPEKSIFEK